MTPFVKVIVLAVIQGLTEFLPVSSSGHLVIAKHLLDLETPGVILELVLHMGTLLAVLVYFRKRIINLIREGATGAGNGREYISTIVLSSVPAVMFYLAFKTQIEELFSNPRVTSVMLCVTGLYLLSLRLKKEESHRLKPEKGFLIGVAQAFALIPGISRSGATITTACHLGISREKAVEFSMLMSVPVLIAALLHKMLIFPADEMTQIGTGPLIAGMAVSFIVGFFAIMFLIKLLKTGLFWIFGFYCLAVGVAGIIILRAS